MGSLVPIVLVLVIVAAAFASFQYDLGRRLGIAHDTDTPAEIAPPQGLRLPELAAPAPVAASLPVTVADPAKVRAALAPYLRDEDLGRHVKVAVAAADGRSLYDNGVPTVMPASTLKLVTGAAALEALGPESRFTTRVVQGATPNQVVLVGGGDPYLASTPERGEDHPSGSDLRSLARRTAAALEAVGRTRVRLQYDDSLFTGPDRHPTWPEGYATEVPPIGALWVDRGEDPDGTGYVADPPREAARVFARELGRAGIRVMGTPSRAATPVPGAAPATVNQLAAVEGAPVREIVAEVLAISDNGGAEVLAHHVGLAEGFTADFDGGVRGVTAALARLGVPLRGRDVVLDGSGLSRSNRLTGATLLAVLALGAGPAHPGLRPLVTGLPVGAGFSGSLARRFTVGPPAGRGRVRAKTGTLSGVHGLAGVATDLDGATLLFVLIADRVDPLDALDARDALDRMAAALGACHCA